MENQPIKYLNHFVALSPLADTQFMLNMYINAFSALGFENNLTQIPSAGPAHPIAEENQRITSKFMADVQLFRQLSLNKFSLHIASSQINGSNLHFIIGYKDPI